MARDNTRTAHAEQRLLRHIQRQQRSGRSIRDYCSQNHIGEKQFYVWRRRFRQREATAFLPVHLVAETTPQRDAAIEIVLDGGRRLRVEPGFDGDTLRRLLQLLEGDAAW